mgnify:CR=1 FL=1
MRLKIIAGNLVTLLVVGIVGFFLVKSQLTQGLAAQVDSEVTADQGQVNRLLRLSALEFVEQVEDRAITAPVTSVFGALDEDGRRRRAFDAATGVAAWFQDPQRNHGGRPDIVAITDGEVTFRGRAMPAFEAITRVINGGVNGLDSRREYWRRARRVLGV